MVRDMSEPLHIISLGAGVQSSTMALMAAAGEITPMPCAAVFADTGDEPASVYEWLKWLIPKLPFPVVTAQKKLIGVGGKPTQISLSEHVFNAIETGTRVSKPPLFTLPDNPGQTEGLLTRDCTRDFKVSVIQTAVREIMREKDVRDVIQWIGISLDETIRMKPSRVGYSTHRWPLIEARMSRHDCLLWMAAKGFPKPPRSACVYCPHHSNAEWRRLRDEEPEAFARAVDFDTKIRVGINKVRAKCFVHRDCVPLAEVDLSTDDERGQGLLWGNECEGMCGV